MASLPARALVGCLAMGVLNVGAVPSASGSPVRQNIAIEDGFVADFSWESCVPQDVTVETDAPTGATALPALGPVEGRDDIVVTAVDVSDGLATWTLAPSEQDCAPGVSAPISPIDFTEPLRLRWKERRYVLKATEKNGVRRIAGWDTTYSRGHNPSVASARRYFGRPSKVTKGRSQDCRLTWNRLGLQITFVNYGGAPPCSKGAAQYGNIVANTRWAVQTGTRPGIVATSSPDYLVERGRATEVDGGWSVAKYYSPFGEPGYYPSVAAIGSGTRINRFEFWIGAGGE